MIRIIEEKDDIIRMINELTSDLSNTENLRAISRIPEPRGGLRYREILKRLYISLGSFQASVVIEFKNGLRRHYVFLVRAIPEEGKVSFADCQIEANGYVVDKTPENEVLYRIFKTTRISGINELYKMISEVGDKFRWSDIEIYLKRVMEYDDYFWL